MDVISEFCCYCFAPFEIKFNIFKKNVINGQKNFFCSSDCYHGFQKLNKEEQSFFINKKRKLKTKKITLICQFCKTDFFINFSRFKRGLSKNYVNFFCCKDHSSRYKKENNKNKNEWSDKKIKWLNSDKNKKNLKTQSEKLSKEKAQDMGFRYLIYRVNNRCKQKKILNNIDVDYIKKIWSEQNGKCPYTEWELELPQYNKQKKPNMASIDRINSSLGYIKGNIRIVCLMANYAKNDFSEVEMEFFCQSLKNNVRL